MKVKRYEAPTLQEALLNVKRDLGSEAVILQTRKFNRGGIFGLRKQDMVEVLAATDVNTPGSPTSRKPAQVRKATTPKPQPRVPDPFAPKPQHNAPRQQQAYKQTQAFSSNDDYQPSDFQAPRRSASSPTDTESAILRQELKELKDSLNTLMQQREETANPESVKPYPSVFGDIFLKLHENDVDDTISKDIISSLDDFLPETQKDDEQIVRETLIKILRRLVKVSGAIDLSKGGQKTVAFVGPTGVGKTTTIAKLATTFSLSNRKKVGIITADTFRIAAVEQIKVYGDIINVPIKVVYNREDMKHAMDYFSDRDLVLIDTAGRSHWDTDRIDELRDLLAVCYPLELNLVLSANIKYRDMLDAAARFRPMAYNNLLFTKLDETSTYGSIINMITRCNAGVSYLCYGQNVPGEIQAATVESLLALTIGRPLSKVVKLNRE